MIKSLSIALFLILPIVTLAAENQVQPPTMQSLLDKGFKVSSSDDGGIILQKDDEVYDCRVDRNGKTHETINGTYLKSQYYCYDIH